MRKMLAIAAIVAGLPALSGSASAAATSGSIDLSFSGDGIAYLPHTAYAVAVQADGKIVVAGGGRDSKGTGVIAVSRFNRDGSLDPSFTDDGMVLTRVARGVLSEAISIQPNGRILVGGRAETRSFEDAFALVRYLPDGSLDTSFSRDGKLAATTIGSWRVSEITDIAVTAHNTIVASAYLDHGHGYQFGAIQLTRRGAPDATFSGDGVAVTRFGSSPAAFAESIAIQSNGSIVAVGSVRTPHNYPAGFAIARYLPDGRLDDSFDHNGKTTVGFGGTWSGASAVGMQEDGKIVVAGTVHLGPQRRYGQLAITLARFYMGGALDASFAGDGKRVTTGDGHLRGSAVAIQSDGKILVGGEATPTLDEYPTNFAIARYTTGGGLDTSFAGDGIRVQSFRLDDWIEDMALQSNGRIIVVGASQGGPPLGYAVARYLP
jgi:uncharacterized delta-60 repeat protein